MQTPITIVPITIIGNLTADPELRFTPGGDACANMNIAVNHRRFNKQTNEWEDAGVDFYSCTVWKQAAENAAEALRKGMRVIVAGQLKSRSYETRDGEKRTVLEIGFAEVGPSLKNATATVTRNQPQQGGAGGHGWNQAQQQGRQQPPQGSGVDPWAVQGDTPPF